MKCSIGSFLKSKCSIKKFLTKEKFPARQWSLLKLRSGVKEFKSVCHDHASQYGRLYSASLKVCCNPLNLHTNVRRKQLKIVSAAVHNQFNRFYPQIIEGQKLCIECLNAVKNMTVCLSPKGDPIDGKGNDLTRFFLNFAVNFFCINSGSRTKL